jgi:hypothetical protein
MSPALFGLLLLCWPLLSLLVCGKVPCHFRLYRTSSGQQSPSLTQWLVPRTLFTGAATMSVLHFFSLVFCSNYNLKLSKPNVLPIFQQKQSTIETIHNSLFCSSKNNFRVEDKMQCPLLSLLKTVYFFNKKYENQSK